MNFQTVRADLAEGVMLLTRLPAGWLMPTNPPRDVTRAVWTYPVVGGLAGALAALVLDAARNLGLPAGIAALLALGAGVLITGGLHEDGLADTADGLGGGSVRARKLEIMRDSRIGAYGVIALILSFGLRAEALNVLAHPAIALIAAGACGRGAILGVLVLLRPARTDGLAAGLGAVHWPASVLGVALAAAIAFAVLPGIAAALVLALSVMATLLMVHLARRQIGGHTGDILGAASQLAEITILVALAAL